MIQFKSLQQRFSMLVLLPVALLMVAMGFAGFSYARNQLLTQWGEATILKLQRAAHHVDMRLSKPKEMLRLFHSTAGEPQSDQVHRLIIDQLKGLDGITGVNLTWTDQGRSVRIDRVMTPQAERDGRAGRDHKHDAVGMLPLHSERIVDITPPRFDASAGAATVSLFSGLKDSEGGTIGRMEVQILFSYLMDAVEAMGWWSDYKSFLVDESGMILTSNIPGERNQFGETDDPMERATAKAMKTMTFGTVFGQGHPPREVAGFCKLEEAPWTLVMIVPADEILSPVIRMRMYYFIFGGIFIMVILFLIRLVTGRTVSSIKKVSEAAHRIAEGNYEVSLSATTRDEVGELIHSFNTMIDQLEERTYLKYSLNLAMEVQRNLLPGSSLHIKALDIAGQSIYCDETGGDYYDFIQFSEPGQDRIGIAVGDVSGHGIASALFMTTARAMIRSRMMHAGTPSAIITDVNRLLCLDTAQTGNFMTLFFLVFDIKKKAVQWVRAGHEPAIFYDAAKDEFTELGGAGMALGVKDNYSYRDYFKSNWHFGQVILIGTDGIWETENQQGERFGKERLREVLRRNCHVPAAGIVQAVTDALTDFRGKATQEDDITLVVIKATS